jgi:hypothetical protein
MQEKMLGQLLWPIVGLRRLSPTTSCTEEDGAASNLNAGLPPSSDLKQPNLNRTNNHL